jgi:predicted nucleotidyltransferase
MGAYMLSIASLLFPGYRQRVLGLLLLHPETRYYVREIARLTDTTAGTLHRELSKLAKVEVLIREINGNQVCYRANPAFLIFEELVSILRKTSGLADVLASALAPLTDKIEAAFVFGSVGRGTENAGSDIDILIIGDISFTDAVAALYDAQAILGREINPKVYQRTEWQVLINNKNAFAKELLDKPKLFIIGTVDDVR